MPDRPARFQVRVVPRSKTARVGPWEKGVLRMRTTKPAVEGKANADVLKVLGKRLGRPVALVRGEKGRLKTLRVMLPAGVRVEQLLP